MSESSEEEATISEEEAEAKSETKRKGRHYLWYLPIGFFIIIGCLVMLKDLYDLYGWIQTLPSYQMSFWVLPLQTQFEFVLTMFRSISIGLIQVFVGLGIHVYSKNRTKTR